MELKRQIDLISGHWPATISPDPDIRIQVIAELPSSRKRCVHWVSEISLTVSRLSSTSSFHLVTSPSTAIVLPLVNLIVDVVQAQALSATVLGKRYRGDDVPKPALLWLSELHKKIWNKKNLRPELFRTVKVTLADYDALQKRLEDLHPNRDSPDYDGNENQIGVLSVKLDFLRSLPSAIEASPAKGKDSSSRHPGHNDDEDSSAIEASPAKAKDSSSRHPGHNDDEDSSAIEASPAKAKDSSSRHPDNDDEDSEANNKDNTVLKTLFPYTLKFLDLSSLGLKEKMPGRFILPLLYRKEYEDISELIKKKPQNSGGSVLVSGQPGSGAFLVSLSHRI